MIWAGLAAAESAVAGEQPVAAKLSAKAESAVLNSAAALVAAKPAAKAVKRKT
jgi:hypothetical protein